MTQGKKENRGGAREGAGRKKKERNWSDALKRDVAKAMRDDQKRSGLSFGQRLYAIYTNKKTQDAVKIAAAKLIAEIQVVKQSEKVVKHEGPSIYLPEPMQPPTEALQKEQEEGRLH